MRRILTAIAVVLALTGAVMAEPAQPVWGPAVEVVDFGIFCRPRVTGQEVAPETTQGYINLLETAPEMRFHQQVVPAALNVSFGVNYIPSRDAQNVRMETWIPGREGPDIWYTDLTAGNLRNRGFTFEYPEELIIGLWRLEAWDGDEMLYSVEFDVVPPDRELEVVDSCNPIA